MTTMSTGADIIAGHLAAAGIRRAFGIPGGEVLALLEGFAKAGITSTLVKHENAAGFMAEGNWHATGVPGLLFATLGPGVANAVNVIANAYQDRVPLIFITGCVDSDDAATYTHQIFDHQALLRPIVKATFRATAESVGDVIGKALSIACAGRPGPVHIDLPIGVAEGFLLTPANKPPQPHQESIPPTSSATVRDARRALATAKRPLLVAGLDVVNQEAATAVTAFARRWSIPVITTYKAKGIIPESDQLALGGAGLSPKADAFLLPLCRQADVVILAGYDPIEMRLNWRQPFDVGATVIDLVAQDHPHGMHTADIMIVGDVAANLAALGAPDKSHQVWSSELPTDTRAALRDAFRGPSAWGPSRVFETVRSIVPKSTVATADSGAHRILLSQLWEVEAPRRLLQSSGFCTMGCAVPLALGYKLACPDSPVLAFVGDAGLHMVLGELATAREFNLPIIIIVLVDSSLALIEMKQRASSRANDAVDFCESDYPAVANALGGYGAWIDDATTLATETRAALQRESFTLLACRIPRHSYDGMI